MDTFIFILQIIFIWGGITAKSIFSLLIYLKSKNTGWLLIAISSVVELLTKIYSVGASFWIREYVHLDDLETFSTTADIISTFLSILYYALAVAGFVIVFNKIRNYLIKK